MLFRSARRSDVLARLGLSPHTYGVITLHRPGNVDDPLKFEEILKAFEVIARETTLLFPVHPRTRKNIENGQFAGRVASLENLILTDPLGYLDFLCLMDSAAVVMTDSGGIQEETTILGVPCMTLRENTERPVTVTHGANRLVPLTESGIIEHFHRAVEAGTGKTRRPPKLWDGKAADRIVSIIESHYLALILFT